MLLNKRINIFRHHNFKIKQYLNLPLIAITLSIFSHYVALTYFFLKDIDIIALSTNTKPQSISVKITQPQIKTTSKKKSLTPISETKNTNKEIKNEEVISNTEPTPLFNTAPPYPMAAKRRGQEGIVKIKMLVNQDGIVSQLKLLKSSGFETLDNSALETLKKWKFEPNLKTETWIEKSIEFKLI